MTDNRESWENSVLNCAHLRSIPPVLHHLIPMMPQSQERCQATREDSAFRLDLILKGLAIEREARILIASVFYPLSLCPSLRPLRQGEFFRSVKGWDDCDPLCIS
jgi:hypothetical protein